MSDSGPPPDGPRGPQGRPAQAPPSQSQPPYAAPARHPQQQSYPPQGQPSPGQPWYGPPAPGGPYGPPPDAPAPGAMPYAGPPLGWSRPDHGGPAHKNRRLVAVVVGALVAIAALTVVSLVAFTGGAKAADPASATRAFLAAVQKQDCDALVDVTTSGFRGGRGSAACRETLGSSGGGLSGVLEQARYTVKSTKTAGNDAKVTVELSVLGRSTTQVVRLKRSDGDWLVDGFGLEGFSGPDLPSDASRFSSSEPVLTS